MKYADIQLMIKSDSKKELHLSDNSLDILRKYSDFEDSESKTFKFIIVKFVEDFYDHNPDNVTDLICIAEDILRQVKKTNK